MNVFAGGNETGDPFPTFGSKNETYVLVDIVYFFSSSKIFFQRFEVENYRGIVNKSPPPLKTVRLFFGKSRDLENSAVRLFFGEISPNLSERLFTIFFQYFS